MADESEVTMSCSTEMLAIGRRHLAVRDYSAAAEALATACEQLAKEHGDTADQCAEAYLWYGKALLGLSREDAGVLGDRVPGANEGDDGDEDQEENGEPEENGDPEENGESEENGENGETEKCEAESSTVEEGSAAGSSGNAAPVPDDIAMPGPSNGEMHDESAVDLDNEDDVDNLQHAWEMLDLSRSILRRRAEGGCSNTRALLADVHLALGEVALESETYDKAVLEMQSCLDIQKELYRSDDRRIAETHYQIGLANSLASSFEDAITHFKNAANILETRIKSLENPTAATEDATVKKFSTSDPHYSVEGEVKELKELLPEIQEKIQDMMDYKAETIKRVRESLCGNVDTNGAGSSAFASGSSAFGSGDSAFASGSGASGSSSSTEAKPAASDISHLIKRKRKPSEGDNDASASKRANT